MKNKTENRICQNCKKNFQIDPDDFGFYEKIKVPPPTWCPKCRRLRRLGWFGHRSLYKRKCDFSGEEMITFYHPDEKIKVYKQDIWWSDKWDPYQFGVDYDFSKTFFEQYNTFLRSVPLPSLHTGYATLTNSPYGNGLAYLKNGYLCFGADFSENIGYADAVTDIKDSFDVSFSNHLEFSYDVLRGDKSSRLFYSQNCDDSYDMYFCSDCVGCSDCIGCINLRNAKYQIFNKQVTPEEFKMELQKINLGSNQAVQDFKRKAQSFFLTKPRRQFEGIKNENVIGDYVFNSRNVYDTYMGGNLENVKYSQFLKGGGAKDSYDYSLFGGGELIYECDWVGLQSYNVKFSFWNYGVNNAEFCFGCHNSNNLFACIGIRKGDYVIFNKKYSKEDYEKIVEKIKEQMKEMPYVDPIGRTFSYGEFFPLEFAPWAYNETRGNIFFPLSKEKAIAQGFKWRDMDAREFKDSDFTLPDLISETGDEILGKVLRCEECGSNYKIIEMELGFYRRFSIPIPRKCFNCRFLNRVRKLNSLDIYKRNCSKCGKSIQTSYSPDRPEKVYCEKCYQSEVY